MCRVHQEVQLAAASPRRRRIHHPQCCQVCNVKLFVGKKIQYKRYLWCKYCKDTCKNKSVFFWYSIFLYNLWLLVSNRKSRISPQRFFNIFRCWTYETSVALNIDIANELPYNDYFEYFGPDFKLHISPSNMANQNTPEYLDKIKWVVWNSNIMWGAKAYYLHS